MLHGEGRAVEGSGGDGKGCSSPLTFLLSWLLCQPHWVAEERVRVLMSWTLSWEGPQGDDDPLPFSKRVTGLPLVELERGTHLSCSPGCTGPCVAGRIELGPHLHCESLGSPGIVSVVLCKLPGRQQVLCNFPPKKRRIVISSFRRWGKDRRVQLGASSRAAGGGKSLMP